MPCPVPESLRARGYPHIAHSRRSPQNSECLKEVMGKRCIAVPLTGHSVKTSCSVFKVAVSVFAVTLPSFFANRVLSTARI
jgi:hypothetical protein